MTYDYLIVGAGFAGSTVAERLASQSNARVLVADARDHVGGNAYDPLDANGIRIHRYGPHIFHTSSERVVAYLSQFTRWRPYEHRVVASVGGRNVPLPISARTIAALYGLELDPAGMEAFFAERRERLPTIRNSEDAIVARVGRELYETLFANYTRKQWGVEARALDASVCGRVPVRTDADDRYFSDTFQAMPRDGYEPLFRRMLDHPNIELALGEPYESVADRVRFNHLVYTGPIDAYFGHCFGPLPYRSLEFRFETLDCEFHQTTAVVNHPGPEPFTRVTEFKHLTGQAHPKTTISREYPRAAGEPYYPIPRPENRALYAKYAAKAAAEPNVTFVGRLAEYRYYNMDQVVASALATFEDLATERVA
ncbi:MAG: UDP-galactopyranose mutase [Candidatus Baltobacteraceae bacterium]|jgi:UDP-galactopyranose mutase